MLKTFELKNLNNLNGRNGEFLDSLFVFMKSLKKVLFFCKGSSTQSSPIRKSERHKTTIFGPNFRRRKLQSKKTDKEKERNEKTTEKEDDAASMTSSVTSKSVVVSGYDASDIVSCEHSKTRSESNLPTGCESWTKPTKSSQRSASKRSQATVAVVEDDHTTQAIEHVDVDENTDSHSEIIEIKITEEKSTVQNDVNNKEPVRKKKKDHGSWGKRCNPSGKMLH